MTDKKNEDYVVRMPESSEKDRGDAFSPRSPISRPAAGPALTQSFSRLDNSPLLSVLAYCVSSISMTVVNKYVVSGQGWNLNFLYLAVQVRNISIGNMSVVASLTHPITGHRQYRYHYRLSATWHD